MKIIVLLALAPLLQAQIHEVQQQSPAAVMGRFGQLDTTGRRLTPAGAKELAKELMLTESPPEEPTHVIVTRSFSVRSVSISTGAAEFAIDYQVLGRLDSSLGFTRLHTPYGNQPLLQSERFSLVLTDTHFERDADGYLQPVKGVPEWRIKTAHPAPHLGVTAAIEYVRLASSRTIDPMSKAKAQRTLADLEVLSQFQSMPMQAAGPSQQGPEDILSQFAQMQMDGTGLGADASAQLGIFLVHPALWRQDKIGVARGFGVKRTAFVVNKAEAYVQYDAVGEVDLQLRFTGPSANGNPVRQNYKLIFDNDYSSAPTGSGPYDKIGPSRWRIDEAPPEQWVSVTTAIKYVNQMRDAARDPAIKANADKTLATLSQYR